MTPFSRWRLLFLLSALLLSIGGPQHPDGTMAEMLGHPAWVRAHVFLLAGFITLFLGLFVLRFPGTVLEQTRRWTRFALIGTGLQIFEMALHTAAVVDHANLVAGNATPVLSTHLAAAVLVYPVFSASVVGLIVAGARDNVLGRPWVSWIGIVGLAAHGVAPAAVSFVSEDAAVLFRLLLLFAVWLVVAGLLGSRRKDEVSAGADERASDE